MIFSCTLETYFIFYKCDHSHFKFSLPAEVQCEDLDLPNLDWISGSRPPHGYKAILTYKCRTGYRMVGQPTLTCEINSKWSPGLPRCESKSNENNYLFTFVDESHAVLFLIVFLHVISVITSRPLYLVIFKICISPHCIVFFSFFC